MTGNSYESVIIEADGGSRGNPGPAAFGAVLKDAVTGAVIAEIGETIGTATNNVAEYRGLIAGLELAAEFAPHASIEDRMDSKLVVEQMSGNWKVKHPLMRPLAAQANGLTPDGTVFTWVPRAQNSQADRLVNEALDGVLAAGVHTLFDPAPAASAKPYAPNRGWLPPTAPPTTLILVRHGVTDHTVDKLFSGGLGGSNPALNDEGRVQIRATGDWLAPLADAVDALISSPVRRTHESAEILAGMLHKPVEIEARIAEMEFGAWDGLTFAQVQERFPEELASWLGNMEFAPPNGEAFREVAARVIEGRDRILAAHTGKTVVVVSHVTPIKTLVADALGAQLEAVYKMELAAASVTVISYFRGGRGGDELLASLRLFNARPTDSGFAL